MLSEAEEAGASAHEGFPQPLERDRQRAQHELPVEPKHPVAELRGLAIATGIRRAGRPRRELDTGVPLGSVVFAVRSSHARGAWTLAAVGCALACGSRSALPGDTAGGIGAAGSVGGGAHAGSGGTAGTGGTCASQAAPCLIDSDCCVGICQHARCAGAAAACAPGEAVVDLWSGAYGVSGIALDAEYVYFNTFDSLLRVSKLGGPALLLASLPPHVNDVAVHGSHVYMARDDGIHRIPKQGGIAEQVSSPGGFAYSIEVDTGWAYFTTHGEGTLGRVPAGGGPVDTLDFGFGIAFELALDETHAYATDRDGAVRRTARGGGISEILNSETYFPAGIAVDATRVYWAETCGPDCGRIVASDKAGGAVTTLVDGLDVPFGVAQDADRVYWISHPDFAQASAVVGAVSKSGGAPTVVATGFSGGQRLALDAACIYFARNDGHVSRVPKP